MRYFILFIFLYLLLSSCGISRHSVNKEKSKSEASSVKSKDSLTETHRNSATQQQSDSNFSKTTERGVDTNLHVPGDTAKFGFNSGLLDTNDAVLLETGEALIKAKKNAKTGQTELTVINKPKIIPVHTKERIVETGNVHKQEETKTSASALTKTASRDSSHSKQETSKKVKTSFKWAVPVWVWIVLIIAIAACIYFKFNPFTWLMRKLRHKGT